MNDDPDSSQATIDIAVIDPAWMDDLPDVERLARGAVRAALTMAGPRLSGESSVEVSVVFTNDARIRELNRQPGNWTFDASPACRRTNTVLRW